MLRSSPYDSAIFDALTIALRKVLDKERDPVAALQDVEQQIKTANPELST
jgi:hypothetical protein